MDDNQLIPIKFDARCYYLKVRLEREVYQIHSHPNSTNFALKLFPLLFILKKLINAIRQ